MTTDNPGFHSQSVRRTTFRGAGVVAVSVALVLVAIALVDFVSAMASQDVDARPGKIWMFFVGVPLLVMGGFCLNAGYGDVRKRHASPDDAAPGAVVAVRCPSCAATANEGARFCASCGQPFARTS